MTKIVMVPLCGVMEHRSTTLTGMGIKCNLTESVCTLIGRECGLNALVIIVFAMVVFCNNNNVLILNEKMRY
jgi:hypothetical protein